MVHESIGKTIQALRKKKGMTQKDLAEQLNVTDKAVSKWERGIARPDIDMLPKLAMVLDASVASLLGAHEEETEKLADCAKEDEPLIMMHPAEELFDINIDLNPYWEHYKERSHALIRQGIVGFLIGSIGISLVLIITMLNTASFNIQGILALLLAALVCGMFFAGVPFGWQVTSRWTIYGNGLIVLFLFMIRIICTFSIAMVGYPVALIYNLIRSQKSKKRVRIAFVIWFLIWIIYIAFVIKIVMSQ